MKPFINRLVSIGIRENHQPWEIFLIRKLNTISYFTMVNMLLGIVFFIAIDRPEFVLECFIALIVLAVVPLLNHAKNYIWASYLFYLSGFVFFIPLNLKAGINSFLILYYFPVIISLVQLLGRKETWKHLVIICGFCIVSVSIIVVGFLTNFPIDHFNTIEISSFSIFNILLAFASTISFALVMVIESIEQDTLIKKMLHEKEILLAEVFHRVKNNMNIVTSLLNLKKITSDSLETKEALEECRNRVFSMALVHQNIFNNNAIIGLDFKTYIQNLVDEISYSLGQEGTFNIDYDLDHAQLDLSTSVPCGLIINELITNAFKYAFVPGKVLEIKISLKKEGDKILLQIEDNGPGIPDVHLQDVSTLGLELVKSLSEQINGTYTFTNEEGSKFSLLF
jgi:two-component sensor histidine kinase